MTQPGRAAITCVFGLLCVIDTFTTRGISGDLQSTDPEGHASFESTVRPLLIQRCLGCHGPEKQEGGLRLDSRPGWQQGGDRGAAIIPGNPADSLLIRAVSYADKDLRMPPDNPLPADELAILRDWIRRGAPDPRAEPTAGLPTSGTPWSTAFASRLGWWSLQPLNVPAVPQVRDSTWSRDPIDQFVLAQLERAGLAPAPSAEPSVLLRRLTFVLTGLPPTLAQQSRFLQDWETDADAAYEHLVDDVLASPHFGERFARHWMDVVRYTDTYGYESDNPANGSHEYRDYLIRAFNQDVGFDQMIREQLAGDLLPAPRIDSLLHLNESLIGPMFYHLGENREGGSLMFNGIHQQMVDNRIDAFSKAFLATTVACARCHDHKFEAVSQRDYYSLAAVFMRPRWTSRVIDAPGRNDTALAMLKTLRQEIRDELAAQWLGTLQDETAWSLNALTPTPDSAKNSGLRPEDVAYPLVQLSTATGRRVPRWKELAAEWGALRATRLAESQRFQLLTDFSSPGFPVGWVIEGDGMRHGYVDQATPLISLADNTVVERLLPGGVFTHALSSKLPGALRLPPQHTIPGSHISLQLSGGEYGGYLVVQANGFKSEEIGFLKSAVPVWKSFADPQLKNGVTGVTVEFATTALNPNFPPRIGLSDGLPYSDPGFDKRSWLGITAIVAHEEPGTPPDLLDPFADLYGAPGPETEPQAEQRVSQWLKDAVRRWCEGHPRAADVPLLNWLLQNRRLPNQAETGSRLAELLARYRRTEASIAFARTATGMDERETRRLEYPISVRGDVDVPGELVPPDFLQMFAGRNDVAASSGSGRLELAESLLRDDQPLTARVYGNRLWQWIFGAGLVATPDDFGHLGEQPSHPDLLDFTAAELRRQGWSTKRLLRRLVLTQTFRQSGLVSEAARTLDPDNRLLHHYPTRRLEAEAVRDALLTVSGRLDPALYGRPIEPPRAAQDTQNKRLLSGPLDSHGRRSLYLQLSIMEPPKFLVAFNLPDLKLPTGRRDVTNVPGQALILLNDPLVSAMSLYWASQLISQPHGTVEARISEMFRRAFGREPAEAELQRWRRAVKDFAAADVDDIMQDEVTWSRLAHAIFNAGEFIYYR